MSGFRDTFDFMRDGARERDRFGDSDAAREAEAVRSDLVDLDLVLHHQTSAAIRVSLSGRDREGVWLPRRAIEIVPLKTSAEGCGRDDQRTLLPVVQVTLPARLAKEKGLV